MELENVIKLINAVSESSLTSFSMEDKDMKLSLGADRYNADIEEIGHKNDKQLLSGEETRVEFKADTRDDENIVNYSGQKVTQAKTDDNKMTINSPLVGVFYSAAAPEEAAYVSVGDKVKKGQVIGIVEAMKLMNEIESDYDGVVTDILVDNEQVVEYGQPMFVISPA